MASLAKGVEMQRTYYWRVDEVAGSDTWTNDSPYDIWSFSTPGYLIVDDIERYPNTTNFEDANQIYNIWADGFNNANVNGALLGNQTGTPLVTAGVHGGTNAVPLFYDNTGTHTMSEISVDPAKLLIGRDWTKGGAKTLVLWFNGDVANNSATDRLYVKVGTQKIVYPGPAADLAKTRWVMWSIDLATLGNLSNVTNFAIGLERTGSTGGTGSILLDDILLYREAPVAPFELLIQAESATITAPFEIFTELEGAMGGQYIGKANGAGNDDNASPAPAATATFTFTVPEDGNYQLDLRYWSINNSDGYWYMIPDAVAVVTATGTPITLTAGWVDGDNSRPRNAAWQWARAISDTDAGDPGVVWTLTAGQHTLMISNNNDGSMLDAIAISKVN